jgi:dihydroxyacetone kinase-like predicted kinase
MSDAETDRTATAAEVEVLRRLARAALEALERERPRIDGLNVYPVPDGDTGANLVMTVRALVNELEAPLPNERPLLHKNLARALLMGARGNSGVILSQIVRGAVEAAPAAPPVDSRALAAMLERAREAAYAAVQRPVEGTMLTLMCELAEEARSRRREKMSLEQLLQKLVERGEEALARISDRLPVLRENGVVDAGAAGLLECLRAIALELSRERNEQTPRLRLVSASSGG